MKNGYCKHCGLDWSKIESTTLDLCPETDGDLHEFKARVPRNKEKTLDEVIAGMLPAENAPQPQLDTSPYYQKDLSPRNSRWVTSITENLIVQGLRLAYHFGKPPVGSGKGPNTDASDMLHELCRRLDRWHAVVVAAEEYRRLLSIEQFDGDGDENKALQALFDALDARKL